MLLNEYKPFDDAGAKMVTENRRKRTKPRVVIRYISVMMMEIHGCFYINPSLESGLTAVWKRTKTNEGEKKTRLERDL